MNCKKCGLAKGPLEKLLTMLGDLCIECYAASAVKCPRCRKPVAYDGAIYCGAACSQLAEEGK